MRREDREAGQPRRQSPVLAVQPRGALRHQDVATVVQLARRSVAEMRDLGDRREDEFPPRAGEAVAPVGFLAVEEERLVEKADVFHRRAAHEHRRARDHVDPPLRRAVPTGHSVAVERRDPRQAQRLHGEEAQRGEGAARGLHAAVFVQDAWAEHADTAGCASSHSTARGRTSPWTSVSVFRSITCRPVARRSATLLPAAKPRLSVVLDQPDIGKLPVDHDGRAVIGRVVDDDDLGLQAVPRPRRPTSGSRAGAPACSSSR
jgi:hypothetical protein